jgi:subtilisin family serine protease
MFQSAVATGSSGVDSTFTEFISPFSSRGPAVATGLVKPDVVAPGQGIGSFNRFGEPMTVNGTSAASPHLAGEVALLISALPSLAGNVDALEALVEQYADPMTSAQTCGGVPGGGIPNNTWGWGRINAWSSYLGILGSTAAPVVSGATGVELSPGRPNPSRGLTVLEYGVPAAAEVSLVIHDVGGRKVREMVRVDRQGPGSFAVVWDGRDEAGSSVAAGVYFACLRVGSVVRTRRVQVVR